MYKRASFGSAAKPGADYCAGLCSWHGEVSVRAAIRDEPAMADAGLGEDACRPVILPVQLAREKICERKNPCKFPVVYREAWICSLTSCPPGVRRLAAAASAA